MYEADLYNADNMANFLGNGSDTEAKEFAAFLEHNGWDLILGDNGTYTAFRDGKQMTESEWQNELHNAFNVFLMNPMTGSVAHRAEWISDYMEAEAIDFEGTCWHAGDLSTLTEVVRNEPNTSGYDDSYGEWRPA